MKTIAYIIKSARLNQWYKNLLIFLPIIFSKNLFNFGFLPQLIFGFISLCFVSSANYIINDVIDLKRDRLNPEKKTRPIASGKLSVKKAALTAIILLVVGLTVAYSLNNIFFLIVLSLFLFTQVYSTYLKHEIFLDILGIALNFILRAVSGYSFIQRDVSPWLVFCTFFLALFLAIGKRYGELIYLGEDATVHRKVLSQYDEETLNSLLNTSTTLLIASYGIFPFFSEYSQRVFYTLPLFVYLVFRYTWLIRSGSVVARHPEKIIYDSKFVFFGIIFTITTVVLIYF